MTLTDGWYERSVAERARICQQPAASIPCGRTKAGLPVGLQLVGPRFADALVLRAARAFEREHPIGMPDIERLAK